MKRNTWFEVSADGLAALRADEGLTPLVMELIQNAFDADPTHVELTLCSPVAKTARGKSAPAMLAITDDGAGFADLSHAWTIFAPSNRKADSEKRGRFNLGEKLVLCHATRAEITTTTGQVVFDEKGRTVDEKCRREKGTEVAIDFDMEGIAHEILKACDAAKRVLVPQGITLTIRLNEISYTVEPRTADKVIEASLPTPLADANGIMKQRWRKTTIGLFFPKGDETPTIYEMGIPIVPSEDPFHYDVGQKIPLTLDRASVNPAWLRQLRTAVMNKAGELVPEEAANSALVRDALASPDATEETINRALTMRYGDKRVAFDPSDLEANRRAVAEGYTLIGGRALSTDEWANVRKVGAAPPSSKLFPTKGVEFVPGGKDITIHPDKWTPGMEKVAELARLVARVAFGITIKVGMTSESRGYLACYGNREMLFNVMRLSKAWFEGDGLFKWLPLIIHELGHEKAANHLSEDYYEALCEIGSRFAMACAEDPSILAPYKPSQPVRKAAKR